MKTVVLGIIAGFLGAAASVASAATPLLKVTVADSSGKVTYKGVTDEKGTFATGRLQPCGYVVFFHSKSPPKNGKYLLVISAGKKKIIANAVAAGKFAAGGVAMKIDVAPGLGITGKVAAEGSQTSGSFKERNIQELQILRMAHQLEAAQSRT